ncbi:CLAVATA3/ESR (CLE)-related protein 46 [Glycine max]|nr:CLAVATA3/ESR (CLE)-related protein 46 [Glycine max]
MLQMRRQILVHLLFAWLLLAASALNHVTPSVQATQSAQAGSAMFIATNCMPPHSIFLHSVHFKLGSLDASPKQRSGHVIPYWVEEKKRKSPSGPNPTENQHPPSKP